LSVLVVATGQLRIVLKGAKRRELERRGQRRGLGKVDEKEQESEKEREEKRTV
jgi:hypothetical protein